VSKFFQEHQNRVLYGRTQSRPELYRVTFRHWKLPTKFLRQLFFELSLALHAWALPDIVLKKVYREKCAERFFGEMKWVSE